MHIQIETTRLILRPFTESDAAAASYNSKQPTVAYFMPEMVKKTEEAALGWISYVNKELFDTEKPCVLFAIQLKTNGAVIGCIFVNKKPELDNELEMGYLIADEYQKNGYATEACKAMIWWTFEKAGQDVLSAIVKPENKASRRVIEKLGFIYGGIRTFTCDGTDCEFSYFRLFHTDYLPGPEWDAHSLYKLETMDAFFNTRADGYNNHMLSGPDGDNDYKKLGSCFPKTGEILEVLDIGCGTGIELDYIWEQAPNAHITCVDISRGMLDLLLINHPKSHDRITTVEASYIDWQYPEKAFDIVVSNSTMHHLWPDEKLEVYKKILNTLKPGGSYIEGDFIVDAICAEQYKRRYEIITAGLSDKAKASEYHIDIPCTLEIQQKLLQDAKFSSVEILDKDIKPSGGGAILRAIK